MKSFKAFLIIFLSSILMTSCATGLHSGKFFNVNNNNTNVVLTKNNFKVVEKVTGNSTATYILGIGGISNKALIAKAKTNMLENANLIGNAKAIINFTTEVHTTQINPFFSRKTITVSAHIIEFTE